MGKHFVGKEKGVQVFNLLYRMPGLAYTQLPQHSTAPPPLGVACFSWFSTLIVLPSIWLGFHYKP